ncbi:MAG: hypothetical protein HY220_00775 [Candidatus Sungbacteria bacterium]|uniref:Uncharacterized protein n=1 Tax=Candidatus Sungiibacteriota bacterium TaxID=2750080 RepID=A0A9D6LR38_9BACT|nr:hypothetical protein [Candidatus Sungbacteria bacterium]
MSMITSQEYKHLVRRQERIERELGVLREVVKQEAGEALIRPAVLKRWEKISRDLDHGKGRTFSSPAKMRQWLKRL